MKRLSCELATYINKKRKSLCKNTYNLMTIRFFWAAQGLSAYSCLVPCVFGNVCAGASFGRSAPPAKKSQASSASYRYNPRRKTPL